MNKKYYKYILLCVIVFTFLNDNILSQTQYVNDVKNRDSIHFIPKEFNHIDLVYLGNKASICSPGYPDFLAVEINELLINIPDSIICPGNNPFTPVIPICTTLWLSDKRAYKYHELSTKMVYIQKEGEDIIYSGEIVEPQGWNTIEVYTPVFIKEKEQKIKEAQQYSDDELDNGPSLGEFWNLNLLEYVDMPFNSGKYEVWMTNYGLESKHVFVEIVME